MPWPVIIEKERRPLVAHEAIKRYVDGERIEDIAESYKLSQKRLYAYVTEYAEEAWRSAQIGAAIERLEKAKQLMDSADSMQEIARARESARLAQWDLERVCRRIYGTDQPPTGQGSITINIGINRAEVDVTPT